MDKHIEYIRSVIKKEEGLLDELSTYAKENKIPIVKPEVASFLSVITEMVKAERILEIGTAIGYSAIILSEGLKNSGRIDTIEREEIMVEVASENIVRAGKKDSINIIFGDAVDVLKCLNTKYSLIFMDCAKGQYIEFYPEVMRLLEVGGVLVADNILFRDMLVDDTKVKRRKKTIVTRLNSFIDEICNDDNLKTSILPIGDGVSISYKIGDVNAE